MPPPRPIVAAVLRPYPIARCVVPFALAAASPAQAPAAARAPHWSYQRLERPTPPARDDGWDRSPLDAFVRRTQQQHGLTPAPAVAPAAWLRRVTLDLTGLPPTPAEVEAYVADPSAAAAARVVDRLLASDAAAERWAMWWLDLARYADSQGYEKDLLRPTMWRYRDWVIDAFRRDLPFDQFTIEQLAGDLLPQATVDQRVATAFHRQTMGNTEGGTDDEEFRVAAVIDRVDTTMSVWMGTTIGCVQCHEHKYDPFPHREFYELFAFFDQTADADRDDDAPLLRAPTLRQQAMAKVLELELTRLRQQLVVEAEPFAAWCAQQRRAQADFAAAAPRLGPWHALGPIVVGDFHTAHTAAFAPEREGVRLDNEQEGQRWQRRDDQDGVVHQWRGDNSVVYLHRTLHAASAAQALLSFGSDDAIKVWWNGELVLDHEVGRAALPDQERVPVSLREGDNTLLLKITNGNGPSGYWFGLRATALAGGAVAALAVEGAPAGTGLLALQQQYLATAPALAAVREAIAAAERELDAQVGPEVPVLQELPADRRRVTHVHRRGNFRDPGEVVTADVPKVWPPLPAGAPHDRLTFARWLVSRDNPLTARVIGNRLWSELFGAGIVTTLEDFGTQGEPPSDPALLDWLAAELVDSGWSLRHLLRTIVLSATYGQSSAASAAAREHDPDNRWLGRGPSFRLGAEMVRDQALAVAGLLTRTVGGPSVMPPQPDGVWMQIYSGERWQTATGPDRWRRSLYTFWRRTSPHPAMLVFDAQSREACVLRRQRTNTPLQSLVLWNDPQFLEPAAELARRVLAEPGLADDAARVAWLWRQCLLRQPTARETARLLELLASERGQLASDTKAAAALAGGDPGRAAWTVLASVVLSLDEFVTRT